MNDGRYNRNWWWQTLRKLRGEWMITGSKDFDTWMIENHGVKILYDSGGFIKGDHGVIDEGKYVVFLLKYA